MATDNLGTLTVDLIANTGGFERGMDRAERKTKALARESKYQGDQLQKLIGQIDPVVAAYGRLDKMEEQLRRHRKAGRLDEPDFQNYLTQITAQRNALSQTDGQYQKTALSAKQLAFATRGLPAQFTDIAVSLQAGQNPLTVFLQQGGQLKDMFGGVGPAARAMGQYVLGLVNPFTVAAAAAAVLTLAYKQGSDEASAYTKAIITTGNAAGVSADGLSNMATRIDGVAGTTRNASQALTLLTQTGKFTEDQIESIAVAAIRFEMQTGTAISKTVDEFKRLAAEPAAASAALNEQYNYLTGSVYAQIAALEAQGRETEAQTLAINAYASAMQERSTQIENNLGAIESAWQFVKSSAAEAWDAMLGVGRPETLEEQLATLEKTERTWGDVAKTAALGPFGNVLEIYKAINAESDEINEQEKTRIRLQIDQRDQEATWQRESAQANAKSIESQARLNKSLVDSRTNAEKLAAAYKQIDADVKNAAATGVAYTEAQIVQLRSAAEKQFTDRTPRARSRQPRAYTEDAGMRMLDSLRQQYAQIQAQDEAVKKLTASQQALVKWEQQLADIKNKQTLTADQKSLLANEQLITAQLKRNAALETEMQLRADNVKALEDFDKLAQSVLSKEEKQLAVVKERFDVLDKARAAGADPAAADKVARDIVSGSTTAAPSFGGIDASIGGVGGEIEKINDAQKELESWYEKQLEMLAEFREARAEETALWDEEELATKAEFEEKMAQLERARHRTGLKVAQDAFSNLEVLTQSENKKLFAIGKAAAVANATMKGFEAIQNALAVPPYPLGLALAVTAGVATAANIAGIVGIGFQDGGYTGNMAVNEVAGVVHGQEFVFDAESTRRIGVGNLQNMRDGKIGRAFASLDTGGTVNNRSANVTQNLYVSGQLDNKTATQLAQDAGDKQRQAMARLG